MYFLNEGKLLIFLLYQFSFYVLSSLLCQETCNNQYVNDLSLFPKLVINKAKPKAIVRQMCSVNSTAHRAGTCAHYVKYLKGIPTPSPKPEIYRD